MEDKLESIQNAAHWVKVMENIKKLRDMRNKVWSFRRMEREEREDTWRYNGGQLTSIKCEDEFSVRRNTAKFLSKINGNRFSPKHVVILGTIKGNSLKSYEHNDNKTGSRLLIRSNRNRKINHYSLKMVKKNNCQLRTITQVIIIQHRKGEIMTISDKNKREFTIYRSLLKEFLKDFSKKENEPKRKNWANRCNSEQRKW